MMKDKNNSNEVLSTDDEHLLRRAAEIQFDKDLELFESFSNDGVDCFLSGYFNARTERLWNAVKPIAASFCPIYSSGILISAIFMSSEIL